VSSVANGDNDKQGARRSRAPRRKAGRPPTGSVDLCKGRWRARIRFDGKRVSLGLFDTELEARAAVAAHRKNRGGDHASSLADFGNDHIDRRELHGKRGVEDDRNIWGLFVRDDLLGQKDMTKLNARDAEEWLDRMLRRRVSYARNDKRNDRPLSRSRIKNALTTINVCLDSAVRMGVLQSNPFRHLRVPTRAKGDDVTGDKWHVLDLEGQRRFEQVHGRHPYMRVLILFALWTGLRQSEQWNIEWRDVHLDDEHPWMRIRFGSRDGPAKEQRGGRPARDVFLLPRAAELLRSWRTAMPRAMRKSTAGLVFPNQHGDRRSKGEPSWWAYMKKLASVPNHFRWHDLRHTCASSLLAGWWGRAWRIEEVKEYLGHSDIKVTQRYARLAASVLKEAVAATMGRPGEGAAKKEE